MNCYGETAFSISFSLSISRIQQIKSEERLIEKLDHGR